MQRFVVRALATCQVAFGIGVEREVAAAPPEPSTSPALSPGVLVEYYRRAAGPSLSTEQRRALAKLLYAPNTRSPALVALATGYPVPPGLAAMLATPGQTSDTQLLATLDEVEQSALVDAWIVALFWGRLATAPEPTTAAARKLRRTLFGRLHMHARLATALVRAQFEVSQIKFTPWRSKAVPPPGYRSGPSPFQVAGVVHKHLKTADAGTWETSVTVELRVQRGQGNLTVVRAGVPQPAGQTITIGRLDLLETTGPVVLAHPKLGKLAIPGGRQLSAWQLPPIVSGPTKQHVDTLISQALTGDPKAVSTLGELLLLVHDHVRRAVSAKPSEPGSPSLRMLLALYDDAVVRSSE